MIAVGNTDASKIYLGTDEINKAYLGNDLVWESNPYDELGYIKSGKILHLDGLTKGDTANAWTDLAQGLVFNVYGAVTVLSDGYSLPGTASAYLCATASDTQIPNNQNATIEVCVKPTVIQQGFVFAKSTSNYSPMFLIYQAGQIRGFNSAPSNGRTWAADLVANQNYTASIEYDKCFLNGLELSLSSSTAGAWQMDSQTNYARVGSRRRGSGIGDGQNMYKGEVYAIRIYNRKLSTAEILHNQQVDNERFNLGLTIK